MTKPHSKYAKENHELTEPTPAAHDYGLLKARKFDQIGCWLYHRRWKPEQAILNRFRRQSLDEIRKTVSDLRKKLDEAYAERERAVKEVNAVDLPESLIPKRKRAWEATKRLWSVLGEDADKPTLNRLQAERDEACEEESRAFEEINSEPIDECRINRVRAYAYALGDYQWTDLKLHVAEIAEYFIDNYGGVAEFFIVTHVGALEDFDPERYDYYKALNRYENPPDYDSPEYDSTVGFDTYEWRYLPVPSEQEKQKLLNDAFSRAWDYAKQLLEGGQVRDFEAYKKRSDKEADAIAEADLNTSKLAERYHRAVVHHRGNEYVRGKLEDRLKHVQNGRTLLRMRREVVLYRLNAMQAVERRHLVGLGVPALDDLPPEQRERIRTGDPDLSPRWGRARSVTQENVVYALEIIKARQEAGRPLKGPDELAQEMIKIRKKDCLKAVQKAVGYSELPSEEQSLSRLHSLLVTHVEAARSGDPTYYETKQSQAKADVRRRYSLDRSNG